MRNYEFANPSWQRLFTRSVFQTSRAHDAVSSAGSLSMTVARPNDLVGPDLMQSAEINLDPHRLNPSIMRLDTTVALCNVCIVINDTSE
jgi:hypothetical protein